MNERKGSADASFRARRRRAAAVLIAALSFSIAGASSAQPAALKALRAKAAASPNDPEASLAYGRALRFAGKHKEAVDELIRGGSTGAAWKTKLVQRFWYEIARDKLDQHDLKGALEACKSIPHPGKALQAACRGEAQLMQNRASQAIPEAEEALAAEADLYDAKVVLGRALGMRGATIEAEKALREAASSDTARPEASHALGLLLLARGDRAAAIALLEQARAAEPGDPQIALDLGEAIGSGPGALAAIQDATAIRPDFAEAFAALAKLAFDRGDLAAAETAATRAIKLRDDLASARLLLGRIRLAQSKWDAALKEAEAANKLAPNTAAGSLLVADAYAGRGDIDLAVEAYQRAFGQNRSDPAPLVRAARACIDAGRLTTARGFAEKANKEFPKWAPAWELLGDLQTDRGDKKAARAAYEAALAGEGPIDKEAVAEKLRASQ